MTDGPTTDRRGAALAALYGVQTHRRRRWLATALAALVGVALASVHWAGLLAGGALVGLAWPTLPRSLAAGFGFGCLVLVAFAGRLALAGTLEAYLAMDPLLAVTVVVPLVAGPLGAAVRGLVPDADRAVRADRPQIDASHGGRDTSSGLDE